MDEGGPVRVLLVDDYADVGETLARIFRQAGGIELAGQLLRPEGLIQAVKTTRPDVVLMDNWIPGWDMYAAVGDLLQACPAAAIVIYSGVIGGTERDRLLNAGAFACVGKYQASTDLLRALRQAAAYSRAAGDQHVTGEDSGGG